MLADGRSAGVRAIDVKTGGGLAYTVLPDRGLVLCLRRRELRRRDILPVIRPGEVKRLEIEIGILDEDGV